MIIIYVRKNPRPFPNGAAAGVNGQQYLLFKYSLKADYDFITISDIYLDLKRHRKLCPDTVFTFEMLENLARSHCSFHLFLCYLCTAACHESHLIVIQRSAVIEGDIVALKIHVAGKLLETVGLHCQCDQVFGGIVDKAAVKCLQFHVCLNLLDFFLSKLNLLFPLTVNIHRSQDSFTIDRCIGDYVSLLVYSCLFDAENFSIAFQFTAFTFAGIEGEIVACVYRCGCIESHMCICTVINKCSYRNGNRIVIWITVRICIALYRQYIRFKQYLLGVGGGICICVAADTCNSNIRNTSVCVSACGFIISQVRPCTGINCHSVAFHDVGSFIVKCASGGVFTDRRFPAVCDRCSEQTVQSSTVHITYTGRG